MDAATGLFVSKCLLAVGACLGALGTAGAVYYKEEKTAKIAEPTVVHNNTFINYGSGNINYNEVVNELKKKQVDSTLVKLLDNHYPSGWFLFGTEAGKMVASDDGLSGVSMTADWANATVEINERKDFASITIPKPLWKNAHAHIQIGQATSKVKLDKGAVSQLNWVRLGDEPMPNIEVIDDNPKQPIFVLGFKKPHNQRVGQLDEDGASYGNEKISRPRQLPKTNDPE